MDLLSYWSVASRQRWLVLVGIVLSIILALLSLVRVSPNGTGIPDVEPRSPRVYAASSTLFVTQPGFPWGRTALDEYLAPRGGGPNASPVPRFADTDRMSYLAALYAELAGTDVVGRVLDTSGTARLKYEVRQVRTDTGAPLPLLRVVGFSTSPEEAIALSNRVSSALRQYVSANQLASNVPADTRVEIDVAAAAEGAEVFQGIRLTPSLMLLILGIALTVLIAFTRNNFQLGRERAREQAASESAIVVSPVVMQRDSEREQRAHTTATER